MPLIRVTVTKPPLRGFAPTLLKLKAGEKILANANSEQWFGFKMKKVFEVAGYGKGELVRLGDLPPSQKIYSITTTQVKLLRAGEIITFSGTGLGFSLTKSNKISKKETIDCQYITVEIPQQGREKKNKQDKGNKDTI